MSKEKTIWVTPVHFRGEVKVDVDNIMEALTKAVQQDPEIRHMDSVSKFMHDLYLQAAQENFKFKTLEEQELFNQFIQFMEAKRKGFPAELNLKTP